VHFGGVKWWFVGGIQGSYRHRIVLKTVKEVVGTISRNADLDMEVFDLLVISRPEGEASSRPDGAFI